ncbi:hypothetical protein BTR22_06165 [Alkalihalophilus pseudofirmus]|uniref:sulfite exporter TauE/SafE family protein n=1 Tax=Alkalihalophilus pseudofirmus TaxID=79885 RepID=UPI0009525591|nr:hypothetical protein BTR22_06165 [Alkalihalophilus pseudofirmus]
MFFDLLIIFLIILVGGFIQGASGFGFGLVVMGFLPLFLTLKESTLIVVTLLLVAALSIIFKVYRSIDLKGIGILIASAMVGRVFSFFFLSTYGEMDSLKKILGFFLIGMVIFLLLQKKNTAPDQRIHPLIPISLGFSGGFIGGIFAVGGPFFVFYFLMIYLNEKHKYQANLQLMTIITSLSTITLHGINGDFNSNMMIYIFIGIIGVCIGTSLGMKWFEKLPNHLIKRLAMIIVFIAALNLIILS